MSLAVPACGGSSEDSSNTGGSAGSGTGGTGGGTGASGGAAGMATGGNGGAAGTGTGGAAGSGTGGTGATTGLTANECVKDQYDGLVYVDYDQFGVPVGSHCEGTNQQDIQDVERLVFLGDSITVGTFPTPGNQVYRAQLTDLVKQKWPNVQVDSCAVNGARVDDFFTGDNQIGKCFPAAEQKKTLIVITMGGNDLADMAKNKKSVAEASAQTTQAIADMKKAVDWLKDPVNFPNGSYVLFANVYEYTDLFADLSSCPTGGLAGFSGEWLAGTSILVQFREGYMSIAKESGADMLFLGETFCGHGYKAGDATGQCYRGPGTENWFDISCIHPTPTGHTQIAKMFMDIINE